ncbi:outer membrane protein assembly factor BamB [Paraferrimonas sedimenticola]|uniref:Outer membrane protein assembly factor BamB n=1 Tax=Paraferrimonas sedimenticola TaxID=375674 RepID=A0AA37RQK1_9GAMM|nr:outer membrane protein assembly factor BamB [Paraferrimonas sedimenticola]GLP95090.1 outer membrane protein assembly factor BamB [Paraferrimonas sedimenticola]
MKFWRNPLVGAMVAVAALTACSSNDVEEEPIAELQEIDAKVEAKILWDTSIGDGVEDYYSRLRPAVRYGKIFVADRFGELRAIDKETRDTLWEKDFSEVFRDSPLAKNKGAKVAAGITVARNKVFIGNESGYLAAFDQETGENQWLARVNGELLSKPLVAEGLVIVHTGAGSIVALNVDNGEEAWKYEAQIPPLTLRGTSSPSYDSGGVFVGSADGKVSVLVVNNGQVAWEVPTLQVKGNNELDRVADIDVKPLIVGDTLYVVGYNGNLSALELRTGRVKWARQYSSFNELAMDGYTLFLVDDFSRVYAVDRRNGLELWSNSELTNRSLTAPQAIGNYVVAGDFEGYLHVFNQADGEIVGRVQVDDSGLYAQPLVMDGKLILQTRAGKVAEIEIQ